MVGRQGIGVDGTNEMASLYKGTVQLYLIFIIPAVDSCIICTYRSAKGSSSSTLSSLVNKGIDFMSLKSSSIFS